MMGSLPLASTRFAGAKRKDKFITLVYQLDQGKRRLLWIGPDRTAKTFQEFFD